MSLAKLLSPRICELGKIKIGGLGDERQSKSGGTYRMPVKYDAFHITTLNRDEKGLLIEDAALMASLPKDADGKIRSLPVSLLSNNIDEVMQASYLWYNGKRLAGKSDGETLTVYFDHRAKQWLDKPKVVPWSSEYADLAINDTPLFKLHCTLNVVLASQVARFGGLYKFRTTSRITSDQLYGSLVQLRQLTGGVLRGLPLRLVIRPMQVAPKGQVTTIYVVHVELQGADIAAIQARALELAQFEVQHVKQLAAAQAEYKQLLSAPDEFDDEIEEAEVAQEFHPHQQDDQPGRLPETKEAVGAHVPPASQEGEQRADFPPTAKTATDSKTSPAPTPTTAPESSRPSRVEIDNARARLAAMQTHEARVKVWGTLPDGVRAALAELEPKRPEAGTATAEDDGTPKAGANIVRVLIDLLHKLGLNWAAVRDGVGKGGAIAEAAGLAKMPLHFQASDLSGTEALALRRELEKAVAEQEERAAKRAANKAAKEEKAGAAS